MNQPAPPLPVLHRWRERVLDESNARLTRDGTPIDVPPKPFAVLCLLARNTQKLVTKDELLDAVWGHRHAERVGAEDHHQPARTLLDDDPRAPRYIETLNRRGYRFVAHDGPRYERSPSRARAG